MIIIIVWKRHNSGEMGNYGNEVWIGEKGNYCNEVSIATIENVNSAMP